MTEQYIEYIKKFPIWNELKVTIQSENNKIVFTSHSVAVSIELDDIIIIGVENIRRMFAALNSR